MKNKKAIIIVSGGMDSVTLLYKMLADGYECFVLSFNYGQRHKKELDYAKKITKKLKLEHKIVDITSINQLLQGSALTSDIAVPEGHYAEPSMKQTVVPNRNMIMLSLAVGYAVSIGADTVAFGAHSGDHAIYPDCRPEFVEALNKSTMIANYQPVEIIAPFLGISKGDIAVLGKKLGIDYSTTWTCYNPGENKDSWWKPNTSELDEAWIIGFIEGEGSFTRSKLYTGKKFNGKYDPAFSVTQQDKEILEKIKRFFGFGSVYRQDESTNGINYGYCTSGANVARKIALWVEGKLKVGKKQQQFNKWVKQFDLLDMRNLKPCGKCGACNERAEAMNFAGIKENV